MCEFDSFIEIWHCMFTLLRFLSFLPGFCKNFERTGLHIQTNGIGPMPGRWKSVTNKIVSAFEQSVDDIIDQRGINDRTIRSDADNIISFYTFRGLIIAVE